MSYGKSLLSDCVFHCTYKDIEVLVQLSNDQRHIKTSWHLLIKFQLKDVAKTNNGIYKKLFIIQLDVSNKEYFPRVSRSKAGVSCGGFHN